MSSNTTNICSPHVTATVRLPGLDKIFYPRVKSQISLSGVQESLIQLSQDDKLYILRIIGYNFQNNIINEPRHEISNNV